MTVPALYGCYKIIEVMLMKCLAQSLTYVRTQDVSGSTINNNK